jgi:hypothetical protein
VKQVEELLCLLGRYDELYLDRETSSEIEEGRLVQDMMSAEARHGFEGGAAANTEFVALLEQPLPRETPVMPVTLVHVKSE